MDAAWFREQLDRLGKTQADAAKAIGRDPSQITRLLNGPRKLTAPEARILAGFFGVPVETLMEKLASDSTRNGKRDKIVTTRPGAETAFPFRPIRADGPAPQRDLPVMGLAVSGKDGWFEWNGQVLDWLVRPHVLDGIASAYAVFNMGSSMEPRYMDGEKLYIHPGRPITRDCFVVVQLKPEREGDAPFALIKQFIRRGGGTLVLHQFNPKRDLHIPESQVISVHRIVHSGEE